MSHQENNARNPHEQDRKDIRDTQKQNAGGMSRRRFLIGSTLAGAGIAAASLAACSPSENNADSSSSTVGDTSGGHEIYDLETKSLTTTGWSWQTPPDDIPDDQITSEVDCDVLVVGSGLAGCCAALAAAEKGAKTIIIEKSPEGTISARGLDIAAFHTKLQAQLVDEGLMTEPDYRQTIRRWVMWAQGRVKEPLLWEWARKSGACFDWMYDKVIDRGLSAYIWDGYYKGPDYTELPVTHAFYETEYEEQTFGFTQYAVQNEDESGDHFGNAVLVPRLYELCEEAGIEIHYSMPSVRLLRDGDGPCVGSIAGPEGDYTRYNAKSTIIATGDYTSDKEMIQCYCPVNNYATDIYIYLPPEVNKGELHKQAMWIGAEMQKSEPHATVTHLDFGAASYGFLHVNGLGERFKNEDVNTQSKSITKAFQPTKQAYTIYDANGLSVVQAQVDGNVGGGLQWGQLTQAVGRKYNLAAQEQVLKDEIAQGLTYESDTLEGLAEQIGCDSATFVDTVNRYNEMADQANDVDYGKRKEVLAPVNTPPYYAGHLQACLLTASGGLRQDLEMRVLDIDDNPIEGLYVAGSAAGDFFGAGDYPTFVAGIGHGRCVTFGRMAGINAAGGNAHEEVESIDI